jgi:hypothetical protein
MPLCLSGGLGFAGLSLSRISRAFAMKRAIAFTLFASAAVGFAQQNKDPVSSVVKEILPHQEKNLVAAVEVMPADKFGYRPTPPQMALPVLSFTLQNRTTTSVPRSAMSLSPRLKS